MAEQLTVPRIIIAGPSSGVGKAIISLGLAIALRKKNLSVSSAILGPHIPLAITLSRLTGRSARCLDGMLLSSSQLLISAYQASVGADVLIMTGHGGLFDGHKPGAMRGSDAEVAALSKTPVALVVDARGMTSSIAALIKGFSEFNKDVEVLGAIANRLTVQQSANSEILEVGSRQYYNACLQQLHLPPLIGGVPLFAEESAIPKELASYEKQKNLLQRQFLVELGNVIAEHIDLDRLLKRLENSRAVSVDNFENKPFPKKARIAVADDACFGACFQDNIDWLRYYGAEIIPFSPLADVALPKKIGAVYMTGGHLGEYGKDLSENTAMLSALNEFVLRGGLVYSEGGGTAFLCKEFRPSETAPSYRGAGLLSGRATMGKGTFRYIDAMTAEDSILGRSGLIIRGVSSGNWRPDGGFTGVLNSLRISGLQGESMPEGFSPSGETLCTFDYLHFGSNPDVARHLVDAASVVR